MIPPPDPLRHTVFLSPCQRAQLSLHDGQIRAACMRACACASEEQLETAEREILEAADDRDNMLRHVAAEQVKGAAEELTAWEEFVATHPSAALHFHTVPHVL